MQVNDLMTKDVATVFAGASIVQVIKVLLKKRIHSVPVVSNDNVLVGIISEKDLFSREPACDYIPLWISMYGIIRHQNTIMPDQEVKMSGIVAVSAEDIMTKDCTTVHPETDVTEVLRIFRDTKFKTLPVVDKNNRLQGIVSMVDVIRHVDLDQIPTTG